MLKVLDHIPAGLLERDATELHHILDGPTLIHLAGRRPEPLFVSVLLHGNEVVGWEAVRRLLSSHPERQLPRALSILIGNVHAAREAKRHLPDQPDYNRIWRAEGSLPEHGMVRQVLAEMEARRVFASIDIHNNTGFNPHYGCINRLDNHFKHLALLFSRTVVFFEQPDSVLSMAFASLCPSTTIECGRPGESHGVQHAQECIEAGLHLSSFPDHPVAHHDIDLFHTVAVVKVPEYLSISFSNENTDVCFIPDLDRLNFHELPAGALLGWSRSDDNPGLPVWNDVGVDVGDRYLTFTEGKIRTRIPVMPSMLTLDPEIVQQDCLCYLMERLHMDDADDSVVA